MMTSKDSIAEAYIGMLEMTTIIPDSDIPKERTFDAFVSNIKRLSYAASYIDDNHYAIGLSDGTMYLYHKNGEKYHSISLFRKDSDNEFTHLLTVKGPHVKSATGIYKNIQYMLDNGFTVGSDEEQTRGGRNLWKNIHHHVDFTKASLHDIHTGIHIKDVNDFSDVSSIESDPYIYKIKKEI